MALTPDQQIDVKLAREALEASKRSTDYAGHCGSLEFHVAKLLALVTELAEQ